MFANLARLTDCPYKLTLITISVPNEEMPTCQVIITIFKVISGCINDVNAFIQERLSYLCMCILKISSNSEHYRRCTARNHNLTLSCGVKITCHKGPMQCDLMSHFSVKSKSPFTAFTVNVSFDI